MKPPLATAAWALATILLAGLTAFLIARSTGKQSTPDAVPGSEADFHRWMHERLEITPDQHKSLEPFEHAFESERGRLRGVIEKAARDLFTRIDPNDGITPVVPVDPLVRTWGSEIGVRSQWNDTFTTTASLWYIYSESELL